MGWREGARYHLLRPKGQTALAQKLKISSAAAAAAAGYTESAQQLCGHGRGHGFPDEGAGNCRDQGTFLTLEAGSGGWRRGAVVVSWEGEMSVRGRGNDEGAGSWRGVAKLRCQQR